MSKILYTATVLSHICQFHLPYLEELQKRGHVVHVAARDNLNEKNGLKLQFTDRYINIPFQRSPKNMRNLTAYHRLKTLIDQERYDLIVCNTPMGGMITRLAAKNARKRGTKVIYIAHGFHFYKGAPKKNWLLFYPVERIMAHLCDTLITITQEDFIFARKKFHTNVVHIHGIGVSPERYHPVSIAEQHEMRAAEGLLPNDFVILCTGELNQNKNQATLIEAVSRCRNNIPHLRVLLAGNGSLEAKLKSRVRELHLEDIVTFLGYRTDLERVVPAVDLIVSCSHREGLPLNILEGMLCAKPIVASINRGHNELVDHKQTGFLFHQNDVSKLSSYIQILYTNTVMKEKMCASGNKKATKYTVTSVKQELLPVLLNL